MTTFYLDTSVAINESFLKSPFAEAFLKACAILQHIVVIPEIVLDELKGNFPRKIQEKYLILRRAYSELGKIIDIEDLNLSVGDEIDKFNEWIDGLVESYGIVLAPYPEIGPKELIEKSYKAKKPFKESGEGYKDYIVWKSVIESISSKEYSPDFIFLTNNTKDFCETNSSGENVVHGDLSKIIDESSNIPKIYTSIKSAFENELSPNLEGMDLQDIPALGDDINIIVGEFLSEDLSAKVVYGLHGVPFNDEVLISLAGEHHCEEVKLKKVGDEVIITVSGSAKIEAEGFIDKFSYYNFDEPNAELFIVDGNWNDHVMFVSCVLTTPYEITIFYSTIEHDITGREVSLPDEIQNEWPYK